MGRGPSYPYVALEEAITLCRKMYDYAKKAATPTDAVIKEAWRYSATSSSGLKVLAALKSFGLVEDAPGSNGKTIKITGRAIRILLDEQASEERKKEIRNAALSPKWYEYCWKRWGKEMPPAMKSSLLIEHGFVDSTVESFLKDYRKTIAFAGLLEGDDFGNSEKSGDESGSKPKVGDYVQWESQGILKMPAAKKLIRFSDDGGYAFVEGYLSGIPTGELIVEDPPEGSIVTCTKPPVIPNQANQGGVKMFSEILTIANGITVQLQWPSPMTQDSYDDFVDLLEGAKKRIKRAVQGIPNEGAADTKQD